MQDHQPSLTEVWQPDKLLDISLQNLDKTKKDLEKNWVSQLISVGASIGVILGLGSPISYKLFEIASYGNVLYLMLPLVNLIFFAIWRTAISIFVGTLHRRKDGKDVLSKSRIDKLRSDPEGRRIF